jgi:flagellar assembly protein FliH
VAKSVFRSTEILPSGDKYVIAAPRFLFDEKPVEEISPVEVYTGPSVDDLQNEAEEFKKNWAAQKEAMVAAARAEAERIIKDAEGVAFEAVRKKTNEAQKLREDAEAEAERVAEEAKKNAEELEAQSLARTASAEREARDRGFAEGREAGYASGREEAARLIDRIHVIMDKAMEKRISILEESESQIVDLVLLITKKVIKVISDNQKNVVVSNVVQALRKLKTRGDVVIRVNIADLQLTAGHTKDFMQMVENAKSITVIEDSTVDRGGCVIETDFGQIDARISSQLHEIEESILESAPIKSRAKEGIKNE